MCLNERKVANLKGNLTFFCKLSCKLKSDKNTFYNNVYYHRVFVAVNLNRIASLSVIIAVYHVSQKRLNTICKGVHDGEGVIKAKKTIDDLLSLQKNWRMWGILLVNYKEKRVTMEGKSLGGFIDLRSTFPITSTSAGYLVSILI